MKRLLCLSLLALVAVPHIVDARNPKKAKKAKKKEPDPPPAPDPAVEMEPAPAPAPDPTPPPAEPVVQPKAEPAGSDAVAVTVHAEPTPKKTRTIYFRAGGSIVQPFSQSREVELADIDGAASLAVKNGPIAGSGSTIDSAMIFSAIIGYQLTPKWSIETVLGLPFTVKFKATGTLANQSLAPMALGIPTGVPPLGEEIGEAKAAPPLVTAVYQLPHLGPLKPYAGAGLSVLFAYGAKVTNPILTQVAQPNFDVSPAPGLVLQTGAEVQLWSSVYARLDVKFIALMLAQATVSHIQVKTPQLPLFDTVEVGTAKTSLWVNPLIASLGIGADF